MSFEVIARRLEAIEAKLAAVGAQPAVLDTVQPLLAGLSSGVGRPRRSILSEHIRIKATEDLSRRGDAQGTEAFGRLQKTQAFEDYKKLAMGTNDATAGGTMVAETLSGDIIEFLRASSAVARLNPLSVQMPTGAVRMVKITGGAVAYYVGENKSPAISQPTTGDVNLIFRKLMVLVPIGNDLLRYATAGSEEIIRRDALGAARTRGDLAFMRGEGLNDTPKGLRNLAATANIFKSAGSSQANITADIAKAHQKLADANMPMEMIGTIMAPRPFYYIQSLLTANGVKAFPSMSEGTSASPTRDGLPKLEGDPVAVSSQYPVNLSAAANGSTYYTSTAKTDILIADYGQIMLGESLSVRMDVSTDGGYTDLLGNQVNAFEKDQTLIRVILEHDIQARYPEAIVAITDVAF